MIFSRVDSDISKVFNDDKLMMKFQDELQSLKKLNSKVSLKALNLLRLIICKGVLATVLTIITAFDNYHCLYQRQCNYSWNITVDHKNVNSGHLNFNL